MTFANLVNLNAHEMPHKIYAKFKCLRPNLKKITLEKIITLDRKFD